ncbi:MAG: serine/threonine protein kinase, partial [Zavarzinella sp.]|nr:serine/threonine protein kinase [Zavarzinella sp.]
VATVTSAGQPPVGPEGEPGIPNPFGRYTVTRLLGRGGMGAVFLAHDPQLDRPVALKIPTFRGALTAGQKERFLREARSIAALRHPNLCPVFDAGEEQGVLYLTMAYIDGQPLSALVERGPVAPEKAVDLVRRVARAMHVAHTHGTVHRDLKPANILIDRSDEPVVMDFGLARRAQWADDSREDGIAPADADLTQFGSVIGTPAYMPPEQARGDVAAIGPRSDVYSLGVILYELLTGRRPFSAPDTAELIRKIENDPPPPPSEFYPWLDRKLEAACLKALAKDPAGRFDTMAAFEQALKDAVDPELKVVLPPPLPPRADQRRPKKRGRHPLKKLAWIAVALTLIVGICVGIPTLAVVWIIDRASDKFKEITQSQREADSEWETIRSLWQPPPADAGPDLLFPPTVPGGFHRLRHDQDATDAELGITLPGRRAVYTGPDGEQYEVRAYRCPDEEAQKIQAHVQTFVQSVQNGTAGATPGSKRQQVVYTSSNSVNRTLTFGFHDSSSQNQEYGKLWHGHGWLFWFKTATPLKIEYFPSKYLMEVWKKGSVPPTPPGAPKVTGKGK